MLDLDSFFDLCLIDEKFRVLWHRDFALEKKTFVLWREEG